MGPPLRSLPPVDERLLTPEEVLSLLRDVDLSDSDCYGCVDWFQFEQHVAQTTTESSLPVEPARRWSC
ncbi:MAG: hypothetical protein NZM12_01535 [Steroidobacteraceae bacterium]|nr:hypothetical protein [Steroidobacteraceae bacterium]MDW8257807.1 hypothetical protein [Gammaproteobacteria bacterium]